MKLMAKKRLYIRIITIGVMKINIIILGIKKLNEIVLNEYNKIGNIMICAEILMEKVSTIYFIILFLKPIFTKINLFIKLLKSTIPTVPINESHIPILYMLYGFMITITKKEIVAEI